MPVRFTSPPSRLDFNIQVWEIVRRIPAGKVMTYGKIAALIPCPPNMTTEGYRAFGPRWVGGAMAACPEGVPWQRVVNSQGRVSLRGSAAIQRELLEKEGVQFDSFGKIDLKKYLFTP
jgi:methylated-DNA-protein-cysteine methyltransferase related protein